MEGYSRENFDKAQTDEEKQVLLKKAHEEASREDKDFEYAKEQKLVGGEHGALSKEDTHGEFSESEEVLKSMRERLLANPEKIFHITVGGKTKNELIKKLWRKSRGDDKTTLLNGSWAEQLLEGEDFTTSEKMENIDLVAVSVSDLGFREPATAEEIYRMAESLGLEICPAEVGPSLLLAYLEDDQLFISAGTELLLIAMNGLGGTAKPGSYDGLFALTPFDSFGQPKHPLLEVVGTKPSASYYPSTVFVFQVRK